MTNSNKKTPASVTEHNKNAWDKYVDEERSWTVPVSKEAVALARKGEFSLSLGADGIVPRNWFPEDFQGKKVLCLACGGGQQAPILAAVGADVTVMDISPKQLAQDLKVAERESLKIKTVQGDMRDLSMFKDGDFDVVFCPVSITYIPELTAFYAEAYRVLVSGGIFMLGAPNPAIYLFDGDLWEQGIYQISNSLPFNSLDELDDEQAKQFIEEGRAMEYSHTLSSIIGGQIAAGFVIDGFYEENLNEGLSDYIQDCFATRARKI
ncbi:class I SAM-dependent methyltransferase [Photobacterium minamisatsumaniensis]|uniref:class I SAM-dependent methyltransferase n=1 Tax=Photobacterium minamisatsumaniensis TaxID=2910233 RepID=UPI003D0B4D37